jgi:hypothetical protein
MMRTPFSVMRPEGEMGIWQYVITGVLFLVAVFSLIERPVWRGIVKSIFSHPWAPSLIIKDPKTGEVTVEDRNSGDHMSHSHG